jgi:adenylate kinase family enzyme
MRRVAVIATASGCGKTTVGRALAAPLGVPFHELDAINHQAGWKELEAAELRRRVGSIVEGDAWVVDGSYRGKLGDLVLEAADTVVWLDLPRRVWLPRLVWRAVVRIVLRNELWNGNHESLRTAFVGRDSLFAFALRNERTRRQRYPTELARYRVARLRTQREVDAFLRAAHPVSDFSRAPALRSQQSDEEQGSDCGPTPVGGASEALRPTPPRAGRARSA